VGGPHAGEIWAIECKAKVNLEVFEQAWRWKATANRIFVAYPPRGAYFAGTVARALGIGVITAANNYSSSLAWEKWSPGDPTPKMDVSVSHLGSYGDRTKKHWDALMVPEAQTFSIAGGSGVQQWTSTRIWELEVKKWVKVNPGKTCEDILRALRPPGFRKNGKPRVVLQADIDRLHYFIHNVFNDLHIEGSAVWIRDDFFAQKYPKAWSRMRPDDETGPIVAPEVLPFIEPLIPEGPPNAL
jgi:hypothetical protein